MDKATLSNPFLFFLALMDMFADVFKSGNVRKSESIGHLFSSVGLGRALSVYESLDNVADAPIVMSTLAKMWDSSETFRKSPYKADLPQIAHAHGIAWDSRISRPDTNWSADKRINWSLHLVNTGTIHTATPATPASNIKPFAATPATPATPARLNPYETLADMHDMTIGTATLTLNAIVGGDSVDAALRTIGNATLSKASKLAASKVVKAEYGKRDMWVKALSLDTQINAATTATPPAIDAATVAAIVAQVMAAMTAK